MGESEGGGGIVFHPSALLKKCSLVKLTVSMFINEINQQITVFGRKNGLIINKI